MKGRRPIPGAVLPPRAHCPPRANPEAARAASSAGQPHTISEQQIERAQLQARLEELDRAA